MSHTAIVAEGIGKTFRIRHPEAAGVTTWLRSPSAAARRPRWLEIQALRDVSFEVKEGEVFGIIGRNGAGKSTLLKILSRITSPSRGRATIAGRVASLLEVGTGFHPDLTGRENVYLNGMLLGMPSREVDRAFDAICDFAGVGAYIDTPIKRYSSGMQLRLAFAVAAHLAADTMIIDEVLAVGDAEFQAKCTSAMKDAAGRGRTTLFVSHNMAAVESLCSRALLLRRGEVEKVGSARDVVSAYLRGALPTSGQVTRYVADREHAASRAAWIASAAIHGPDAGPPVQGDDLVLRVELGVRERIRGLQLVAWLNTVESQPVAALSNGDYRDDWDLEPGMYEVTLRIPSVRLLPRAYTLSLQAVVGWGAEIFDDLPEVLTFSVLGRDVLGTGISLLSDRGVTWLPAEYEIAPLVDAAAR